MLPTLISINNKYQIKSQRIIKKILGKVEYPVMEIYLERIQGIPYRCPISGGIYHSCKSKNEKISIKSFPIDGHLVELIFPRERINNKEAGYPYEPLPDMILSGHRITKGYAEQLHEMCKVMTVKDLEKYTGISDTVLREIDKSILEEKVRNRKIEKLTTLGVDEIQVGKGHNYFHVISEIDQEEILHVGEGRKIEDLVGFFWKYRKLLKGVKWMVMDFWQGFISGFSRFCKNGKIIHDHYHIVSYLNKAIDELRKQEYKKASSKCKEIFLHKKWLLLKNRYNLTFAQKVKLNELFIMNKKLWKSYWLKEKFRRLWSYKSYGWALNFWKEWKKDLRWQRLKPLGEFVEMVDRHLEGIMNYFKRKETLKMGYIEGTNNKIKVLIRRHYGIRDKEYLKLKIIQCGSKSLKVFDPHRSVITF